MSKHTPGPWRYSPAHKDIISMASVGRDDLICDVHGSEYGSVLPSEANARLIAAAPEMLEALEKMVAAENKMPGYHPQWMNYIRAIVAKAKGE